VKPSPVASGSARSGEAEFPAKQCHIPQNIPAALGRFRPADKEKRLGLTAKFADVAEQRFSQLNTEGDQAQNNCSGFPSVELNFRRGEMRRSSKERSFVSPFVPVHLRRRHLTSVAPVNSDSCPGGRYGPLHLALESWYKPRIEVIHAFLVLGRVVSSC